MGGLQAPRTAPAKAAQPNKAPAAKPQARPAPPPGGAAWAKRVQDMPQSQLFDSFAEAAGVYRELMMNRAPIPTTWRQFRQFLLDVGPKPAGPGWVIALKDGAGRAYETGNVSWSKAADPDAIFWVKGEGSNSGEWNKAPRTSATDPTPLDVDGDFSQIDSWLPGAPAKQAAFQAAFKMWRRQVKPNFRKAATPAFLFLYSTVSALRELRDRLAAEGLMDEHTARNDAREHHPAWSKYCELMGRAQAVMAMLPEFGSYSLFSELDKLEQRLIKTERKYRT